MEYLHSIVIHLSNSLNFIADQFLHQKDNKYDFVNKPYFRSYFYVFM